MGKRGPTPTPTNVLKMRGSWRGEERQNEPQPVIESVTMPRYLKGRERGIWQYIAPKLLEVRVFSKLDRSALARYCQLEAKFRETMDFLEKNGDTYPVRDKDDNVVSMRLFPQTLLMLKLCDQLGKLESHFGLTPASRTRIEVMDKIGRTNEPIKNTESDDTEYIKIG